MSRAESKENQDAPFYWKRACQASATFEFSRSPKDTLKAVFDIALPSGLMICGAMLHKKAGKPWVALPGKPYLKNDGSQAWARILDFTDRAARERFEALILPLALNEFARATEAA